MIAAYMLNKKKLVIISNEKTSINENGIYCDNIDLKTIPEGLNETFKVLSISRKSNLDRFHKINLNNIKIGKNIFSFLSSIFATFKEKETIYLLISITPYTFLSYCLLFIFRKKIFVYLRSNGYEEYKSILGFIGPVIYHLMYSVVILKSNIITCQKRLAKSRKYDLVFPSEIDDGWLKNISKSIIDKPRLLYVGRIKIEKGIFSLFKIFDKIENNINLSIVGKLEKPLKANKKINFLDFEKDISKLIKIYDNHNITILPSFTEAHPKVLDESLARLRPVIIFEEISHVIQNRKGIYISKRNAQSLLETINFIMKNYKNIEEEMKKNKLPTKQEFILQISKILNNA